MPEDWVYREPQQRRLPPRADPPPAGYMQTQGVPVGWQPERYDPNAHRQRVSPRLPPPQPYPPTRPATRPAFTPSSRPLQGRQPGPFDDDTAWGLQPGQPAPLSQHRPAPYQPLPQPRGYYQPYRPDGYGQPGWVPSARRKPRVFLWVFLAVQVLFLVWIIAGVASHPAGPTAAQQAAQQCAGNGWYPLFRSQADCQVHYAHALNEAGNVGKGLGVAAIVIFWVVVDFFLGIGYVVYKLASRR